MLRRRIMKSAIFLIALSFALSLLSPISHTQASTNPLSFTVKDLMSGAPVSGQVYELTDATGKTKQLKTDAQGLLNLGVLEPGFYTLEQIRYYTLEDGTSQRSAETRDIIRIQADDVQALNGYTPQNVLQRINPLDQTKSGLVFRFWDSTGVAAPYQSLTLTRAGYELSEDELTYRADLEAYLAEVTDFAAAEEGAEEADKAGLKDQIANAQKELDRLAALSSEDKEVGTYQADLQGILHLSPLSPGKYYVSSSSIGTMEFYLTESQPVAYLGQMVTLSELPKTTSLTYQVEGPEEDWEVTGTLHMNGSPYKTASWTAEEPVHTFTELPSHGPDRAPHSYYLVWDSVAGYASEVQGNVLTLTAEVQGNDLMLTAAPSETTETSEEVQTVEISFESGGGIEIPLQTVEVGMLVEEPEMPTIEGQEFLGWYYLDAEEVRHDFDFTEPVSEDLTLIADWSPGFEEPDPTTEETTTESTTTESTTSESTTTETTTEPTTEPTTAPTTTEPTTTPEPTTAETTTEPTTAEPTTEPTTQPSRPTLPSLPDFPLPMPPEISPDQPNATLPPRPGAQPGGVQRPSPAARPGGELLGENGFADPSENPPTYDPGMRPFIVIAAVAIIGILVLEIWQRRRED